MRLWAVVRGWPHSRSLSGSQAPFCPSFFLLHFSFCTQNGTCRFCCGSSCQLSVLGLSDTLLIIGMILLAFCLEEICQNFWLTTVNLSPMLCWIDFIFVTFNCCVGRHYGGCEQVCLVHLCCRFFLLKALSSLNLGNWASGCGVCYFSCCLS